jgi:pentatricopeptide repeat protein
MSLLHSFQQPPAVQSNYRALLRVCEQEGLWQRALQLLGEMEELNKLSLMEQLSVKHFNSGVHSCVEQGRVQEAYSLLHHMKARSAHILLRCVSVFARACAS